MRFNLHALLPVSTSCLYQPRPDSELDARPNPAADLHVAPLLQPRSHRSQLRLPHRNPRPDPHTSRSRWPRHDLAHVVHHQRSRALPPQAHRPPHLLGRRRVAQRRNPYRRFLRPRQRHLLRLAVASPRRWRRPFHELLVPHALRQTRPRHHHQRGQTDTAKPLLEHRLPPRLASLGHPALSTSTQTIGKPTPITAGQKTGTPTAIPR